MAFSWVPFALAALLWDGNTHRIEWLVAATLAFSVSHQPLTMPLVYADRRVFQSRRRIFTWSPLVVVIAVVIGLQLNPLIIAAIAGVWNAAHTLQQRYGITRIYGRKVGQTNGHTEHRLLWTMLLTAVLWAAADPGTSDRVAAAGLGGRNQRSLAVLTDMAPVAKVLLPLTGLYLLYLVTRWVSDERRSPTVNPAKWMYLGSTAGPIGLTVISPIAGFVGYVGSHAAEYYLIVHRHLGDRYPDPDIDGGAPLGKLVRARTGPTGALALYTVLVVAAMLVLRRQIGYAAYSFTFLSFGALHLFYDGLIWKLRRPDVARGFRIQRAA